MTASAVMLTGSALPYQHKLSNVRQRTNLKSAGKDCSTMVAESNKGSEGRTASEENVTNTPDDGKAWGYDLYPERRGTTFKPKWGRVLLGLEGKENLDKLKCERNVYWCIKNSPLVKLMMGALKSSGCPIDIRRHISCEVCENTVTGGYDPITNQIVVCQNMARKEGMVQGVLTHEMIHMFDYCNNDLDFKNIDHLACTEIRAANLAHCSFLSAWFQGDASFFNIKEAHQVGDACIQTFKTYTRQKKSGKLPILHLLLRIFPIIKIILFYSINFYLNKLQ